MASSTTAIFSGVYMAQLFLFSEQIRTGPWYLAGETLGLALVIVGALGLSRSCFILGEFGDPSCLPTGLRAKGRGKTLTAVTQLAPAPAPQPAPAQPAPEPPRTRDDSASPRGR